MLSKYEDLSYKQISEVMKLSVSSVESLIFRAKQNLQKIFWIVTAILAEKNEGKRKFSAGIGVL